MTDKGIYTLANDAVLDQLIALLNSIRCNAGSDIPVKVIPYDDNIARTRREIRERPHVSLFDEKEVLRRWESLAEDIWGGYEKGEAYFGRHSSTVHRKLCVFDGPFDRFVFMDADTLLMDDLEKVFTLLGSNDLVTYDYQYKDPSHVFSVDDALSGGQGEREVDEKIFCVGFFASKKSVFSPELIKKLTAALRSGDVNFLYPRAPEQSLLNYMVIKGGLSNYNIARHLSVEERTGNSVTSSHFREREHILYDKGVRLMYLHYIGVPGKIISKVCAGENLNFPYRDIFLHYRFLKEPSERPEFRGEAKPYVK
ncbi:MAG: sugar transferase, partial [Candidatus Omnitrophica bacterium]|nr:sugar transferase [Candidatus Omnitrophota bacterium]